MFYDEHRLHRQY